MFWVNQIVQEILKQEAKSYLVSDYKTPSGKVHVGALRGVLIHDAIYKGLKNSGVKTKYLFGFDDFDPMDGLPTYLDEKKYRPYMGLPLCNIPSPEAGYKSYAEYYAKDFLKVFNQLGAEPKIVWDSEVYKKGEYNEAIKIILNNTKEVRKIYQEISGSKKDSDWYPLNVVCPQCGKIGTTKVTNWDGKEVSFSCKPKMVTWAEGCGYQGKISPFDGNAKLPYKPAVAARWFFRNVQVELAGMDHYTKGGVFYVAREIAKKVLKIEPAYGHGYEWLMLGGKSMSSSRGVGFSAEEVASLLPAELLRFLMMRTKEKKRIEFSLDNEAVPRLYDEFDRCLDEYLKNPKSDFGQAYKYSKLTNKKPPVYRLRFSKIAYLLQMPRADVFNYAEKEKGKKLTKEEREEVKIRQEYAKKWLETYAPDNFKFVVQEKMPQVSLNNQQKKILQQLLEFIAQSKKLTGEEIHAQLHQIKKEKGVEPKEVFEPIYQVFLNKKSGPQAGWLLASLERDFVVKRLEEVIL